MIEINTPAMRLESFNLVVSFCLVNVDARYIS